MQQTMNLLTEALRQKSATEWCRDLGLARNALSVAKVRGHLSPAIAGALAEKMGSDPEQWIVIAALESERDSACKTRMLKRLSANVRKLYFSTLAAARQIRRVWSNDSIYGTTGHAV